MTPSHRRVLVFMPTRCLVAISPPGFPPLNFLSGIQGNGVDLHQHITPPLMPNSPPGADADAPHPGCVFSVALTRNGRMLASGCDDGVVRLWRKNGGESMAHLGQAPGGGVDGGYAPVTSVDFSRSGQMVAAGYSNYFHVRVWSVATLACTALLKGHSNHVMCIKFAPHIEDLLATASCDGTVRLWSARCRQRPGACLTVIDNHNSMMFAVGFSPSGALLAAGGNDRTCRLWEVHKLLEPREIVHHKSREYLHYYQHPDQRQPRIVSVIKRQQSAPLDPIAPLDIMTEDAGAANEPAANADSGEETGSDADDSADLAAVPEAAYAGGGAGTPEFPDDVLDALQALVPDDLREALLVAAADDADAEAGGGAGAGAGEVADASDRDSESPDSVVDTIAIANVANFEDAAFDERPKTWHRWQKLQDHAVGASAAQDAAAEVCYFQHGGK